MPKAKFSQSSKPDLFSDPFIVYRQLVENDGDIDENTSRVYWILDGCRQRSDAIVQDEIGRRLQISPATVRESIRYLRRRRIHVCTGSPGCWINKADLQESIDHIKARIRSMQETVHEMEMALIE